MNDRFKKLQPMPDPDRFGSVDPEPYAWADDHSEADWQSASKPISPILAFEKKFILI
jgi:hypothetical protein